MKHTAPRAAALCLVAALAASAPAHADPTSLEDALANVLVATLWHAVGLPTLGGDIESSTPLETTRSDPGGVLLTLSRPDGARALTTLVWADDRSTHQVAAEFIPGQHVALQWGAPVFLNGRRVLVVEGRDLAPGCGEVCAAMELDRAARAWRTLFVHTPEGRLRRVGELVSADRGAILRTDGACVYFGEAIPRCWDPSAQVIR